MIFKINDYHKKGILRRAMGGGGFKDGGHLIIGGMFVWDIFHIDMGKKMFLKIIKGVFRGKNLPPDHPRRKIKKSQFFYRKNLTNYNYLNYYKNEN